MLCHYFFLPLATQVIDVSEIDSTPLGVYLSWCIGIEETLHLTNSTPTHTSLSECLCIEGKSLTLLIAIATTMLVYQA